MKTLAKRIENKLTKKDGTIKVKYDRVIPFLKHGSKTYLHQWVRSGRYSNLRDREGSLVEGLNLLGVDYKYSNDAPRGGMEGAYVELTAKGKRQVKFFNSKNS